MTNEKIVIMNGVLARGKWTKTKELMKLAIDKLENGSYIVVKLEDYVELTKGEKNDIMSCGRLCEVGSKEPVTMKIRKSWLKKLEGLYG